MTPAFIHDLIASPYPVEVTEAQAAALVLAGLAVRVESHYALVEASDAACGMSEGEIVERLARV